MAFEEWAFSSVDLFFFCGFFFCGFGGQRQWRLISLMTLMTAGTGPDMATVDDPATTEPQVRHHSFPCANVFERHAPHAAHTPNDCVTRGLGSKMLSIKGGVRCCKVLGLLAPRAWARGQRPIAPCAWSWQRVEFSLFVVWLCTACPRGWSWTAWRTV